MLAILDAPDPALPPVEAPAIGWYEAVERVERAARCRAAAARLREALRAVLLGDEVAAGSLAFDAAEQLGEVRARQLNGVVLRGDDARPSAREGRVTAKVLLEQGEASAPSPCCGGAEPPLSPPSARCPRRVLVGGLDVFAQASGEWQHGVEGRAAALGVVGVNGGISATP